MKPISAMTLLMIAGCTGYLGGYGQSLFLGARLVDEDGDPLNHCQAGAQIDGNVREWQSVETNMRAIFQLSILANEHRIIIQCSGYDELIVVVIPQPSGGWIINGDATRANESVDLGELTLSPRL